MGVMGMSGQAQARILKFAAPQGCGAGGVA